MTNIQIYNKDTLNLSEVAFVRQTTNFIKIRNIKDAYKLSMSLAFVVAEASLHIGVKSKIEDITKKDIKDLILMRFKNLSINEIAYAFKLERYGVYSEKTDHFQLFNAEYVGKILDKYIIWKREIKKIHNISNQKKEEELTEEQKQNIINQGVLKCYEYFLENESIESSRLYVYDVLYDLGWLPMDKETKLKVNQSAKEVLKFELYNTKPKTREEKHKIKSILDNLDVKKSPNVVAKAKEITLCKYFRNIRNNKQELNKFKKQFKSKQ